MDIERDPSINKLESDIFAKMSEISKPEPGEKKPLQNDVKTISPEEAIKELLELEKDQTDSNT